LPRYNPLEKYSATPYPTGSLGPNYGLSNTDNGKPRPPTLCQLPFLGTDHTRAFPSARRDLHSLIVEQGSITTALAPAPDEHCLHVLRYVWMK
jgi:hypothetical protein